MNYHYSISTHTSLTGRDIGTWTREICECPISTHTSLTGRDFISQVREQDVGKFLLTRPSRDVTDSRADRYPSFAISTHTSLTGRD